MKSKPIGKLRRDNNRLLGDDWSISDPLSNALSDAMHTMRYEPERMTPRQRWLVLEAAEAWRHVGTYGTGPFHRASGFVLSQVRAVRRAVTEAKE